MQKALSQPTLILMAGLPGAGKSSLSLALGRELGWPVLDKDTVKTTLLEAAAPENIAGPASYYVPLALCEDLLVRQKLSVIFDSPAAYPNVVEQAQKIAHAAGGTLIILLCDADHQVRNQRLASRSRRLSQMANDPTTDEEARLRFSHLSANALRLDMQRPIDTLVEEVLANM
ncbi:MAG: AAA family ATPase [Janthinobacterium lividum]